YGPLEHEPFHAVPIAAVQRRREIREPFPEYVQAFRLDAETVATAMSAAGFQEVKSRVVPTGRSYCSLAAALALLRESPALTQLLSVLPADQQQDAWNDIADGFRGFETANGLRIPGEQGVIAGTA